MYGVKIKRLKEVTTNSSVPIKIVNHNRIISSQ